MKICSICGDEFEKWELQDGICSNCLASMVHSKEYFHLKNDFI